MSPHEHSWALISTCGHSEAVKIMLPCCQECSWVLISADCAAAPSSWVCWIGHDCLWVLKSACDRSLVQKNAHEEPWTSICIALWRHEHSWALMSGHEHSWLLRCNHKQSKALMSKVHPNNEHLWALMSTHEHSRALNVPWPQTLNCSWVPTSAHESSWVLLYTY